MPFFKIKTFDRDIYGILTILNLVYTAFDLQSISNIPDQK